MVSVYSFPPGRWDQPPLLSHGFRGSLACPQSPPAAGRDFVKAEGQTKKLKNTRAVSHRRPIRDPCHFVQFTSIWSKELSLFSN